MSGSSRRLWVEAYLVEETEDGTQRVQLPNIDVDDVESLATFHDLLALWTIS